VKTQETYEDAAIPLDGRQVLLFWFRELTPEQWWKRNEEVDRKIKSRFATLHERLAASVPDSWVSTPHARLAAIIVLDQFSRNLFRADPRAFAQDADALRLAEDTISRGDDMKLEPEQRAFVYMPFQHSEDVRIQARSVELFKALGEAEQLDFAIKHKEIIDRFGRFPHRNCVLGRPSTPEETEFLKAPGLFW
jgi:uncharacterized protein (DUF924 family)